jgi:hypothetical protein
MVEDQSQPHLNHILRNTPGEVTRVNEDGSTSTEQVSGQVFRDITLHEAAQVNFCYTGRQRDFPSDNRTEADEDLDPACDDLAGTLQEDFILVDSVIVKSYNPNPNPNP